ncbi:hypothetical protein AAMO2058_000850400 [Amorphochlora amoebiformis]
MTGRKLLHVACEHGHLDVVRWLVDLDVTLDPQDRRGETPLSLACGNGNLGVAQLLLESKANVNAEGSTAFFVACDKGKLEIARLLVDLKANLELGRDGVTPLLATCKNGHLPLVECLVEAKANVRAVDRSGNGPLHLAVFYRHISIVEYLVEDVNVDIQALGRWELTPLGLARRLKAGLGGTEITDIVAYLERQISKLNAKAEKEQKKSTSSSKRFLE